MLVPSIYEMVVYHPRLARKAQPGHFVIVMADERGERIPLTVADFDREKGTITLVVMAIGTSTRKLVRLAEGDSLFAMIGPLGHASELDVPQGTVIMVAGGVGIAPIYPIARAFKEKGHRVIIIQGSRNKDLLFWTEKAAAICDEHIITTDDGSAGRKALVTEPLKELLEANRDHENDPAAVRCIYTIGPAVMMKFCTLTAQPYNVPAVASLNSIMIDGTGMCGGCRVRIGGETKFTCVDGPEFDAFAVDWNLLMSRQKTYCEAEKCSLDRYVQQAGMEVQK
ncbi:MAG: sulfide/dihydroorotate dehydrogenase-like FAD/NAD-binding protein [Planctomycetia bacterium]|nr:sulfide/dihydroorotate dehydrogenase-like FAD/NAD-binding protein [Planctomycetia bacterium]